MEEDNTSAFFVAKALLASRNRKRLAWKTCDVEIDLFYILDISFGDIFVDAIFNLNRIPIDLSYLFYFIKNIVKL